MMKCANDDGNCKTVFARGLCQACYYRMRRRGTVTRKNVVNSGRCQKAGCEKDAFAKNLCAKHYQQARAAEDPLLNVWKNLRSRDVGAYPPEWDDREAFGVAVGERPSPKHQLRRIDPSEPWAAGNFVWREPIPIDTSTSEGRARYAWVWHLRNKYGLSPDDVLAMAEAQGGGCGICRRKLGELHPDTGKPVPVCVDHDHRTKKVRELLCSPCNKGLGHFEDRLDLVRLAGEYLARHQGAVS